MKKLTVLTIAAGLALGVSATDYTWTGAEDNYWTNKNNWAGGKAPTSAGANDRVIIEADGDLYIRNNGMSTIPSTVKVNSGNVMLGGAAPYTSNGGSTTVPLTFDIAKDATLTMSNRLERSRSPMDVTKTGEGTLRLTRPCGADSASATLGTVDVQEGGITYFGDSNWILYCTNLVVRKDAVFNCQKGNGIRWHNGKNISGKTVAFPCLVTVEKGGTLQLAGGTIGMTVSAMEGDGTIKFSNSSSTTISLAPTNTLGSCVFSGNFTPTGKAKITLTAGSTGVQTIGGLNSFGDIYYITADGNNLGFAPGVEGEFKIAGLTVRSGTRLNLEDTDGNPVSVSVSGTGSVQTSGSGSIKFTSDRSVLGDALAHTGTLSASSVLTFGDGASAANDADLSTLSAISAAGVALKFNAADDFALGVPSVRAASLDVQTPVEMTVTEGRYFGGLSLASYNSGTVVKTPTGTKIGDVNGGVTVRQTGGEVYLGGAKAFPDNYELLGGRLTIDNASSPYDSTRTAAILLDGGRLAISMHNRQYIIEPFDSAGTFAVSVGVNGAFLEDVETHAYNTSIRIKTPFASGVTGGTDGGIEQKTLQTIELYNPMSITGPYRLLDGRIGIMGDCDLETTPAALGMGDVILGNARIYFGHMTYSDRTSTERTLALASGAGARLVVSGASEIYYTPSSADAAQHVTAGALARTRGGVLFLADAGSSRFDGTAATTSLRFTETIPSKSACGLPCDPVLLTSATINADQHRASGSSFNLATINAEGYVEKFTDYKTSLSGVNGEAVRLSSEVSLAADTDVSVGALWSYHNYFTLNAGSRVRVGDGVNPGLVLLETVSAAGSGTVDFGAAEGVVVINSQGSTSGGMSLPWTLAGSDGVSFVATPWVGYRRINLTGAANWSGVTTVNALWLDPRNNTSLGSKVVIGAGKQAGGTLTFSRPVTFTSDIEVSGWGVRLGTYDNIQSTAAILFETNAVVSGDVELKDETHVIAKGSAVRGTISGVVSGDRLSVYCGSGTLVLTGDNTYTNGTFVRQSRLAIARGSSVGTGDITLDNGTLIFENAESVTFANRISGVGTIALAGTAPVLFRNDMADLTAALDLYGTTQTFTEIPPFGTITNSLPDKATLALADNLGTVDWPGCEIGGKISIAVGAGTVLDLGGRTIEVYRLEPDTARRIINGTVNELRPLRGFSLHVR